MLFTWTENKAMPLWMHMYASSINQNHLTKLGLSNFEKAEDALFQHVLQTNANPNPNARSCPKS